MPLLTSTSEFLVLILLEIVRLEVAQGADLALRLALAFIGASRVSLVLRQLYFFQLIRQLPVLFLVATGRQWRKRVSARLALHRLRSYPEVVLSLRSVCRRYLVNADLALR